MEAPARRRLVRDIMNSPLVTAHPEDSVSDIAKKMVDAKVGSIVIIQGEQPVGIISDGDVVSKVVARNISPSRVLAKDIMSKNIPTISADLEIPEASRIMRNLRVKRAGVTYRNNIVGMVSITDLLSATPELMDTVSEKTRILRGEERRLFGYLAGYCDICRQWSDYLLDVEGRFVCQKCRSGEV